MPKVLIITGDAAESLEVMHPYQRATSCRPTSRSPSCAMPRRCSPPPVRWPAWMREFIQILRAKAPV